MPVQSMSTNVLHSDAAAAQQWTVRVNPCNGVDVGASWGMSTIRRLSKCFQGGNAPPQQNRLKIAPVKMAAQPISAPMSQITQPLMLLWSHPQVPKQHRMPTKCKPNQQPPLCQLCPSSTAPSQPPCPTNSSRKSPNNP